MMTQDQIATLCQQVYFMGDPFKQNLILGGFVAAAFFSGWAIGEKLGRGRA